MTRKAVSLRLPRRTIGQLKILARYYGSQSNTVIELVDDAFGCPICGERDMDQLVWDEQIETVTCGRCGHRYNPLEG